MRRFSSSMIGAAAVAAFTLVYLFHVRDLPWGAASAPEAGFVPKSLGWILLILCLLLILREAVGGRPPASPPEEGKGKKAYGRTIAAMAALVSYPLLMPYIGFIATTGLSLLAVFRIIRYRTWAMSVLAAGVITAASYFIFTSLLGVYFPRGIFG